MQVAVGTFALVLVALFASRLLLLDPSDVWAAIPVTTGAGATLFAAACVFTLYVTSPLRRTLSGLTVGAAAVPPEDLLQLYALPAKLTLLDTLAALVVGAATLVHPLRPATSDLATQGSLVLLGVTFASAAVLPLYVMMRSQVAMVLEVAPLATIRDALFRLSERAPDRTYVRLRFVFAVDAPRRVRGARARRSSCRRMLAHTRRRRGRTKPRSSRRVPSTWSAGAARVAGPPLRLRRRTVSPRPSPRDARRTMSSATTKA